MGWVKLEDGFFRHPKAIAAGRDGRMLFVAGLCYCGSGLTDGFIPSGAIPLLTAETGITNAKAAVSALVSAGLWEDTDAGFQVHDYLEYNTSAHRVRSERSAAAERMRRRRSEDVRPNNARTSGEVRQPEEKRREIEQKGNPPKGSPLPEETTAAPPKPKRRVRLAADWSPSEANRTYAQGQGMSDREIDRQAELFRDHWLANGETKDDWDATWRNWIRRAPQFERPKVVAINGRSRADKPDFAQMVRDMEAVGDEDPWT